MSEESPRPDLAPPPSSLPPPPQRQLRLDLAYDGTAYAGWQVQPDVPTVQGVVEAALAKLLKRPVRVLGASRTDAGVHALQQVCVFRAGDGPPPEKFRLALAPFLPGDVSVLRSCEVPDDFHPLRSVTRKTYRYLFHEANAAHPVLGRYAWRIAPPLDLDAMNAAAAVICGTHDFACFESTGSPRGSTVRTLFASAVAEVPAWPPFAVPHSADAGGRWLQYEVTGDGFLYNMVRAIAGTLADAGRGKLAPADVAKILASKDRTRAAATAPAKGLTLASIETA